MALSKDELRSITLDGALKNIEESVSAKLNLIRTIADNARSIQRDEAANVFNEKLANIVLLIGEIRQLRSHAQELKVKRGDVC